MIDHCNMSSTHLTPYIIIKILLTIFPMLCFTAPKQFYNWQLLLLNPKVAFLNHGSGDLGYTCFPSTNLEKWIWFSKFQLLHLNTRLSVSEDPIDSKMATFSMDLASRYRLVPWYLIICSETCEECPNQQVPNDETFSLARWRYGSSKF